MIDAAARHLDAFKMTYGVRFGELAEQQNWLGQRPGGMTIRRHKAQLGATVYAAIKGKKNPDTFDPHFYRKPIFDSVAPRGMDHGRARLALAAASQHLVQYGIGLAQFSVVAAYLCTFQATKAARQLGAGMDPTTLIAAMLAQELIIVPYALFACVLLSRLASRV